MSKTRKTAAQIKRGDTFVIGERGRKQFVARGDAHRSSQYSDAVTVYLIHDDSISFSDPSTTIVQIIKEK